LNLLFDLASLATAIERRDDGLWLARKQAGVSYPEHGNAACLEIEDGSFWFRHRNRCIVSVIRRFPPDGAFLDIGGGNGYVAKGLIEAGIACVLIEPGIDGALAARARGVDPVICARLEDIGLAPASVAAAGMFDVLEHIEDETATLRQVYTLLNPGGRVFLTVPAYPFLFSADDEMAGHYRRYTISSLTRALVRVGFRMDFASHIFGPLPPLVFLLRTVPSRLGLRRTDRAAAEHAPVGIAAWLLNRLLAAEYRLIDAGRTIPIGGSCLAVGVKD
jgi:SAM-dependent methyltransferase